MDLPDDLDIHLIRKLALAVLADDAAAIRQALSQPGSSPPLAEIARAKRSACILICDITRRVPNHLFLQPMIRILMAAGIPADGITVLIATGLVEPHFMADYSGGRKVIAPGIAHEATIRTFHSARFMEDPAAIQCNLRGNPLHEEQLEIIRMLGEVYALLRLCSLRRRVRMLW